MTALRRADSSTVRELLTQIPALTWSWRIEEFPNAAAQLRWKITRNMAGSGAVVTTDLDLGGDEAMVLYGTDTVDQIAVRVTEKVNPESPEGQEFIQDAFADIVAAVSAICGEPSRRVPGYYPRVHWQSSRHSVSVTGGGSSVLLSLLYHPSTGRA
jgi:hypothetical protein